MIALVDYGMGNLRSVEKALIRAGGIVRTIHTPEELESADRLVLPGVGAFTDCMANLRRQNLVDSIVQFLKSGKPFLGICLGYQVLFELSEEGQGITGLGYFKGHVIRFPTSDLKVPQIGWNQIKIERENCPLLKGIKSGSHVYFVHSYFPKPADSSWTATSTEYGLSFASMVWRDNVFACQFHPEKSQNIGLQLLQNFVNQ